MKIYFAGTRSRESMELNKRLGVVNHLESYLVFLSGDPKKFFNKLLNREKEVENINSSSKRDNE